MNKTLKKILPVLAIVVGIGGAYATANVQSDCEREDLVGYDYSGTGAPTDPPGQQEGLTVIPGQLNQDYFCDEAEIPTCRWVYVAGTWVRCNGNRIDL